MTDDNTVVSTVMDKVKMDGTKVKVAGTKYTIASSSTVYVNGVDTHTAIASWVTTNAEGKNIGRASSVQAISNDDSNKINILKVTTYDVKKVTYVGTDYINAGGSRKNDAWNYPSDIKKDDYAVLSTAKNYADDKGLITKAETVEGKVVGTKGNDEVKIGDTWYTADYKSGSTVIDNWPKSGATVKLVLVNGFVKLVDTVTAGTADMAMVIETGSASGLGSSKVADLLFADSSRKTVELNDDSDYGYNGDKVTLGAPKMATYEVSKGKYTLKKVGSADADRNGYDVYATNDDAVTKLTVDGNIKGKVTVENGKPADKKTNQKLYFKSNAVVFVKYKTDDYKVVTGKDVANWSKTDIAYIEVG